MILSISFTINEWLAIIVVALISFVTTYLTAKAQNLARKEDIDKITRKVENVKFEYAEKLSSINTKLDFASGSRLRLWDKQLEATLAYFDCCNILIHEFLPLDARKINADDTSDMERIIEEFVKQTNRLKVCSEKVSFLIYDDVVTAKVNSSYSSAVKYYIELKMIYAKLTHAIYQRNEIKAEQLAFFNSWKTDEDKAQRFANAVQTYTDRIKQLWEEYRTLTQGQAYNLVDADLKSFSLAVKNYLYAKLSN